MTTQPPWRAGTAGTLSGTSFSVSVPSGLTAGDLVAVWLNGNASSTFSPPDASWTQKFQNTSGVSGAKSALWWHKATSGDTTAGSWTFTQTLSAVGTYICGAWSGADVDGTPVPAATNGNSGSGTSTTLSAITPGITDTTLVGMALEANTNGVINVAASMTQRFQSNVGTYNGAIGDQALTSSGSTGTRVFTNSPGYSGVWGWVIFAIAPVPPAVEVDLTIASDGTSTTSVTVTTVQEADLTISSAGTSSPTTSFITTPRLAVSSAGAASPAGSLRSPERLSVSSGGLAALSSALYAPSLIGTLAASGAASPAATLFAYSLMTGLTSAGVATPVVPLRSPHLFVATAGGSATVSGQVISRILLITNADGTSTAVAVLRGDMPIVAVGTSTASNVLVAPVRLPIAAGGVGTPSGTLVAAKRLPITSDGTGTPTATLFARSLIGALSSSGAATPSGVLSAAAPLLAGSAGTSGTSLAIATSYFIITSGGIGSIDALVGAPALVAIEADGLSDIHMSFYGGISGINVSKRFNAGHVRNDNFLGGYVVRRRVV